MKVIKSADEILQISQAHRKNGDRVGLVPTMGALHAGHISLVTLAQSLSNAVVMSIFVNPLQFNNKDDLAKYPRTLERDLELAEQAKVNYVFVPDVSEIYPELGSKPDSRITTCQVRAGSCAIPFEGEFRPGHFDGVATVVSILFNITQPDVAVFGEKDFQQVKVIEQMVRDLHMPIKIITGSTLREKDGVAMSSRNMRLDQSQRTRARAISKALFAARNQVKSGVRSTRQIEDSASKIITEEGQIRLEYLKVVDRLTLQPLDSVTQSCQLLMAGWCDQVRLIDNIELSP